MVLSYNHFPFLLTPSFLLSSSLPLKDLVKFKIILWTQTPLRSLWAGLPHPVRLWTTGWSWIMVKCSDTHLFPLLCYPISFLVLPTQSQSLLWQEVTKQESPTHSLQSQVSHTFWISTSPHMVIRQWKTVNSMIDDVYSPQTVCFLPLQNLLWFRT